MDKKIYVFDMDDTLVDSHRRYQEGILRPLDEAGIAYDEAELIPFLNPLGLPKTGEYYASLGVPGTAREIINRIEEYMLTFYTTGVRPLPGADAYLRWLKETGARLFLLTATPHRVTDPCLRVNGLYDLFEQVWCTDDFGHVKSEPVLFRQVTEAIGCQPEEITYYDDGVIAIRTARSVGWYTCGVMTPIAVETEGMEDVAHTCIRSFEELI